MSVQAQRLTGTVKWYNRKQGFGFIAQDRGGEDIFVHRSALPNTSPIVSPGDRISFVVDHNKKGPFAKKVAWLEDMNADVAAAAQPEADVAPEITARFDELGLHPALLRAVQDAGYTDPTPIQVQAIPQVLAGRDVLGGAQTGTGKTAAFALPILQRLSATGPEGSRNGNGKRPERLPRALILSPTRELALQIAESLRTYGQHTSLRNTVIYGGVGQNPQVQALKRGVDILVATPGRLLDLMGQGYVKLHNVEVLVLDEADRMLDMGFIHDVRRIIKAVPNQRQTLLFSATLPREIVDLADSIMDNPVEVAIAPEQPTIDAIEQSVFFVPKDKKQALLEHVLEDRAITRVLVFTRTKHGANRVVKHLKRAGIQAEPIHGNKSQTARQTALKSFRDGKTRVLVATDVVARGIDVEHISHVIQFDLPNEPETYVHRIGRTGRAGAEGKALAFCSDSERSSLQDIEKFIHNHVPVTRNHPYRA